jgi:hypothetical protein
LLEIATLLALVAPPVQVAQASEAPKGLKRLQDSQAKQEAAGVKKALEELLDLVDVLEKP